MHLLNTLPQRLDPGATPTFTGLLAGDGTAAAPSISFAAEPSTGWYLASAGTMALSLSGTQRLNLFYSSTVVKLRNTANNNEIGLVDAGAVQITAAGTNQNITLTPSGTGNTAFVNPSTGQVTITNTTNPATNSPLNVTGQNGTETFVRVGNNQGAGVFGVNATGHTVVEANTAARDILFRTQGTTRAKIALTTGNFLLGTTTDSGALLQVGTNTTTSAGGMIFGTDTFLYRTAAGSLQLTAPSGDPILLFGGAVGNALASFQTSGTSLLAKVNTITALTLDSSQNGLAAGNWVVGAGKYYGWTGRATFDSPADGIIALRDAAGTNFTRLQFGGTTSSFPALARSTTSLQVKLADDSAFTNLTALTLTTSAANTPWTLGAANAVSPTAPNRTVTISIGGTTYYLHAKTTND